MNQQRGQEPQRLGKGDVLAVAVGTVIDAVIEFLRRLNELQQELDNPPDNPGSHRRNG